MYYKGKKYKFNPSKCVSNMLTLAGFATLIWNIASLTVLTGTLARFNLYQVILGIIGK